MTDTMTRQPSHPVEAAADRIAELERENARVRAIVEQQSQLIYQAGQLQSDLAIALDLDPVDSTSDELRAALGDFTKERRGYQQRIDQIQARLAEGQNELARVKAAFGAPRAMGLTYVIDTLRGDAIVALLSDGTVQRYAADHVRGVTAADERKWQALPPVPGSRAAVLAAPSTKEVGT